MKRMPVAEVSESGSNGQGTNKLVVALPEPGLSMTQDAEWCVVQMGDEWQKIRFHDYDVIFSIPGLYEKVLYDILECDSPRTIRRLLQAELSESGASIADLHVLDLGAGNGMVGEELAEMGIGSVVGVDIIPEAALATERDRPGIYDAYYIVDMTDLSETEERALARHECNALVCVAALGFGDIPVQAFVTAYNLIKTGGWVAFNIKEDFLTEKDPSGFSRLIRRMLEDGTLELKRRELYRHRWATNREPLNYVGIVGTKQRDIAESLID
jgi:SAM-dependent methyltransferase